MCERASKHVTCARELANGRVASTFAIWILYHSGPKWGDDEKDDSFVGDNEGGNRDRRRFRGGDFPTEMSLESANEGRSITQIPQISCQFSLFTLSVFEGSRPEFEIVFCQE